jgi:hypothetical protein
MKSNGVYFSFLGIMILLSIGFGIITRISYVQNANVDHYLNNADQYKVSIDEDPQYIEIYFDNIIDNISELEKKSDVIVRVKADVDRLNYMRAILTGTDVLDVYKGNDVKKGEHIYIFEPSNFFGSTYFVTGGYNIMNPGQEYILFLKHLKIPEGYRYKGKEAVSFITISTYYGKYPATKVGTVSQINESIADKKTITYNEVKYYDLITANKDIIAKYYILKDEVLLQMK